MLKIYVNNIELFVKPNSTVLEACEIIGIEIPRFCYHETLSIAGNCRMCLVEVEKSPKPVVSCAMPVMSGMKIFTNTPLVKKAREGVLEFLLLNHPLDCPICDQGGECDLQDQAMLFGNDRSRFYSFKRTVEDKNVGPLIKTIMTRCIHCTRCVRFAAEIAGIEDLGTTARGTHTEIGTYIEKIFQSELSGNVIDLCPVGALTSKPYAFTSRPWELKVSESIDITDGLGSNIRIDFKETEIMRILPRFNKEINSEWISNKARFSFDGLKHKRLSKPYVSVKTPFFKKFQSANWEFALSKVVAKINKVKYNENIVGVCGLNTDLETQITFKEFINFLGSEKCGFERALNIDIDFSSQYKFNKGLLSIKNVDLCLLIGTNPRYEGSLLNVHLRKKMLDGNFKVASIGTPLNLTYPVEHLGLGTKVLKQLFVDQTHPFINELKNAQNPLIIVGSSILKRKDSKALISLLNKTWNRNTFYCSSYKNNKDINFLNNESNQFGALELGLTSVSSNMLNEAEILYLVGIDYYIAKDLLKLCNKNCFIIYQNSHANSVTNIANVLLPTKTFVEKVGTYINTEGRTQKTSKVLSANDLSRHDGEIFFALWSLLNNKFWYWDFDNYKDMGHQIPLLIPGTNSLNKFIYNKEFYLKYFDLFDSVEVLVSSDELLLEFDDCFSVFVSKSNVSCFLPDDNTFLLFEDLKKIYSTLLSPSVKQSLNFILTTRFNSIVEDFYLTSTLTKASPIMSDCSKSLIKEASNFNTFLK